MIQTQVDLYVAENGEKIVTMDDLVQQNYLTDEQERQASSAKISIDNNNHVMGPAKRP
ncbi:hypothetical protein [Periweissella fabalis]|uniref:Uncharacterized protein n=1 Tax=Periweissella fabalis TaxID=1070421 RepID=A0A7X6N1X9_9LACO|nr:hypothetical protein [Periweissella fabalis]NKZ24223.1 hypothetical protein [Periweissella fabalis]